MDAERAIWSSAGPKAVHVREGGEVLETIELDRFCFATMLGGEDGCTLFIVSMNGRARPSISNGPGGCTGRGWKWRGRAEPQRREAEVYRKR